MQKPSLARLTATFFRIGNTTFGGGYVTMAALGREMIELRNWITDEQYALAYAMAGITPGTNIIAFCAATGSQVLGWMGAVAGVMALTAPSALLAVLIMQGFESGASHPLIAAAVAGTVAAVSGMMWSTVWMLVRRNFTRTLSGRARTVAITGISFLASWKFHVTPLPILAAASLAGWLWRTRE
jgi:chromate transporter